MSEEILSSTNVGLAVGSWFAAKIFGPSADAMGQSLKLYLQSQLPKIFALAEEKVNTEDLQISEISLGLLTRMIVDASSSSDDDSIRDWWSSLFVDAAISEENVHSTLSDMMAFIGPVEAALLSKLYGKVAPNRPSEAGSWKFTRFLVDHNVHEFMRTDIGYLFPIESSEIDRVNASIENFLREMPALPSTWSVPIRHTVSVNDGKPFQIISGQPEHASWYEADQLSYDILERARILRISRHELPSQVGRSGWVEFVEFTQLGMTFYETCTGMSRSWRIDA